MKSLQTLIGLAMCAAVSLPASAQNWTNWRGPAYNGSADAKNLPVTFSKTENVKWKANLPGPAASTPIILEDSVFLTSTDFNKQALLALCLDRKTGKVKWQKSIGSGYQPGGEGNKLQLDDRSNYASPSPTTDGKTVVFFFGNGDLAAFDTEGKALWQRNLQKEDGDFAFQWTFSSSPLLYNGKLYLQVLQRNLTVGNRGKNGGASYLLALHPATGKELWRVTRETKAQMESREAYSTPMPHTINGKTQLIIAGGDIVTGHDPATGKELWRWGTYNPDHREPWFRTVVSPVAVGDTVLVCAPKRAPVYAVKPNKSGDLNAATLAWKSEDRSALTSDVPTPLSYNGKFYIMSDQRKSLSCVAPETGKVLWTTPLPENTVCWGSPTGADGKVYALSLTGDALVFDAATGKLLHQTAMGGEDDSDIRSTVAVAHGNLFIRTGAHLYCIGK